MDWFIERLAQEDPSLDYRDLLNHGDDFKTLLDQKIIRHTQTLDSITCDLCNEEHSIQPFRNAKDELVISCSGNRRVVHPDELKIWTINRDALAKNVRSKSPIIDRVAFEESAFAAKRIATTTTYSSEPISLKAINLEIRGTEIFRGGVKASAALTDTDRRLVYFLYSKYNRDNEQCSTLEQLTSKPFDEGDDMAEGYIKNRIVEINKTVKESLAIKGKSPIPPLVKYENSRGYRLNPKVMKANVGSKENHKK